MHCDFSGISEAVDQVKQAKQSIKEVKNTAKNLSKLSQSTKDFEKHAKRLKGMKPVTKEKIKAWMPKELAGMKRTKFNLTTKLGVADITSVSMTFEKDKKNKVVVKVVDGAGEGASILSPFLMVQKMSLDIENEKGYQRTETFDGTNVLVEYKNPPKEKTSMKYVLKNRFLVEINGAMNPKDLWALNKKLNIPSLEN